MDGLTDGLIFYYDHQVARVAQWLERLRNDLMILTSV
jgi:hypothetical protein